MKTETMEVMERLETAAATLETALDRIEARQRALTGELERISATVETQGEYGLADRLAAAEQEIERLRGEVSRMEAGFEGIRTPQPLKSLRQTLPNSSAEMLAKHALNESAVDMSKLDAALKGLSLEQRIAVKNQLRRAGSL